MKNFKLSKIAWLISLSISFIGLNNCSDRTEISAEKEFEQKESAGDFYVANRVTPLVPGSELSNTVIIETKCSDGRDEDGDGLIDCQDRDCFREPECSEWGPPLGEITNSRGITVYPNGLVVPEDLAILKARAVDDDNHHDWNHNGFFATDYKDCWISPIVHDPYYNVALGDPLVAGPEGAVGPLYDPTLAFSAFGPRAGLINECSLGEDLFWVHADDDNGPGAGASSDFDDEEGGSNDDSNDDSR